jgi:hypothetical protein
MKTKLNGWVGLTFLSVLFGCDSLSDYSTTADSCYVGSIIDADFVRSGSFDADVRLTMSLDVNALAVGDKRGAVITTNDGLFVNAPVKQMSAVTLDVISQLRFPGGRTRNYLAYAPDREGQLANVVISLMENGDVEVRIFRPSINSDDALFGVFRLRLKEGCNPPAADDEGSEKDTETGTHDAGA